MSLPPEEKTPAITAQLGPSDAVTTSSLVVEFRYRGGVAAPQCRAESGRPGMDPRTAASPGVAQLDRRVGASEQTPSPAVSRRGRGGLHRVAQRVPTALGDAMLTGSESHLCRFEATSRRQNRLINAVRDRRSFVNVYCRPDGSLSICRHAGQGHRSLCRRGDQRPGPNQLTLFRGILCSLPRAGQISRHRG